MSLRSLLAIIVVFSTMHCVAQNPLKISYIVPTVGQQNVETDTNGFPVSTEIKATDKRQVSVAICFDHQFFNDGNLSIGIGTSSGANDLVQDNATLTGVQLSTSSQTMNIPHKCGYLNYEFLE